MGKINNDVTVKLRYTAWPSEEPGGPGGVTKPLPEPRMPAFKNIHPSGLRRITERRVAHLLMRNPGLSRAELAKQSGLSVPTIGKIIDTLMRAGIVEVISATTKESRPTLGRPAERYSLMRTRARHVVVELGVSKSQVAVLPMAGPIGDVETAQFRADDMKMFESRLRTSVEMLELEDASAVLVSVPGIVDEQKKRIIYSPNLHWTEGTELFDIVSKIVPSELIAVQEIRALALGYLVRADPRDSYFLVDSSDGVGGAMVVNGQLYDSPLPLAGELGHTPMPGNRRSCGCGGIGCLETLLGRRGMLQDARQHSKKDIKSWSQLAKLVAEQDLPAWLQETLDATAQVVAGALNAAGLSKVVLTGDLPELGPAAVDFVSNAINNYALWARFGSITIEVAPRQRLLGMARAALDRVVLAPTEAEESLMQRA